MERIKLENTQIPLHYQISDYLLMMLKKGDIVTGEKLPPEEELKEMFGVSRTTIRRALEHLLHKGYLLRKQGKGTFWTETASQVQQEKLSGINRQIFNISEKTNYWLKFLIVRILTIKLTVLNLQWHPLCVGAVIKSPIHQY